MKTHNLFWKWFRTDNRKNRFSATAMVLFGGASVMLFVLTVALFVNLLGAVTHLMERAQVPDYLQMHAGELQESAVAAFAEENTQVTQWQISRFLNLDNSGLYLGEHCLLGSTQDNGLVVQNPFFDLLLDEHNELPEVEEGTVWVPVCYRQQYGLHAGEVMQIGQERLVIAGFIRDAQMNSMMASSKRFLVCESDYQRLCRAGSEEYLIEFRLVQGSDTGAFATAYADAGLPMNGPAITAGLIRMMNALSDGVMILLILLVSLLVFLISAVCIRFVLLTRVEKEKREIGMMKALGMDRREVRKIYFAKYAILAGVGAVVGTIAAWCVYPALSGKMQELYGEGPGVLQSVLFSILGAALVTGGMLFFVYRVLRKIERITALDALFGREGRQRGGLQRYLAVIAAVCTFLMVIPANLYHTMASPSFVTYMGIGNGELRIDIRQGEQKMQTTQKLLEKLGEDARVERFALLQTSMQRVQAASGSENLLVESGDHTLFLVSYHEGRAPEQTDEIALSVLEAKELGAQIGDTLRVEMDGKTKEYRVCGLYSDITNGGKTAKASAGQEQVEEEKLMWNIIYLSLKDGVDRKQWAQEFREIAVELAGDDPTQAAVKVVSIREYVQATYGQTLGQIRMAAVVTDVAALGILLLVTMLFLRLLLEKKRYDLSLQKALGFGSRDLAGSYFRMGMVQTALGAAAGILLGNLLGEKLCGMALQSFGADGFRFACDWMQILLVIPALSLTTAGFAVWIGIYGIDDIRACECCRSRE